MTVYVLTITHRHGLDNWVCATEAIASATLDNYVQEWWKAEMPTEAGDMPENPDDRIQAYFDHVEDESYSLNVEPVLNEPIDMKIGKPSGEAE